MPGLAQPNTSDLPQPLAQRLCVVLHDVAPLRWAACLRVLTQLRKLAVQAGVDVPVTLLVVPQMHGQIDTPRPYLRWLHRMQRDGHELALHGLTHRDDGPPCDGLQDHVLRRWYTDGEGEFAAIGHTDARQRLAQGLSWAAQNHLAMTGFVPPAYLLRLASHSVV